ncbi:hypothetical protein AV530_018298 [Patagioenas fasciata monilis]|uniref:Uncharacterized protein n=1 Tax=Patagioenas fasciata monilis TaxID=372326 RepID=A0A1V4JRD8_PATFA|nr:hypothetical protein AV530_018298 [Patagioenas fasciata monilis]
MVAAVSPKRHQGKATSGKHPSPPQGIQAIQSSVLLLVADCELRRREDATSVCQAQSNDQNVTTSSLSVTPAGNDPEESFCLENRVLQQQLQGPSKGATCKACRKG